MSKGRMIAALGCILLVSAFPGCDLFRMEEPAAPLVPGWDTTFHVGNVRFPADSIQERAIVVQGNSRRLDGLFGKCRGKDTVRVGFIGGSITGGALAPSPDRRYSSLLVEFLGKACPHAEFLEINAGVGATNSRFGVSRLEDDILAARPDLIVIEFAVNDDHSDPAGTAETIEAMVRKCMRGSSAQAILFQTMDIHGSKVNHDVQAAIGRHYEVPVISYHAAFLPLVASGQIPWSTLSPDDVHPNGTGHLAGAYLLFSFLLSAQGRAASDPDPGIPRPLASAFYESAGIYKSGDPSLTALTAGWEPVGREKGRTGFATSKRGDSLRLITRYRELTLMFHFAQEYNAWVEVRVDGQILDTLSNHFAGDWGGGFLKPRRLYRDSVPSDRVVELINISGGYFDLRYLLFAE
jgi:hypothetical protein